MKTKQNLKEKLKELNERFQGIEKCLRYDGGAFDMTIRYWPEDVECIETEKFEVVAAKMEEHSWSEYGGGVGWTNWVMVLYRLKDSNEEFRQIDTKQIQTRDHGNANYDRRDLWPYNFVKIEPLKNNKIKVAWVNQEGEEAYETIEEIKL